MAKETSNEEAAASATAAFMLAQMTFWRLLQQGLLPKSEAERMLRQAVEAGKKGDVTYQLAAAKLAVLLQTIRAYQPLGERQPSSTSMRG